jgi:hypothetical protein
MTAGKDKYQVLWQGRRGFRLALASCRGRLSGAPSEPVRGGQRRSLENCGMSNRIASQKINNPQPALTL